MITKISSEYHFDIVLTFYSYLGLIHTNLADFMKCIPPDEIIVGPVVEMTVEGGESFELPVIIQVPHCVPAGKVDDIRAWYGTGKDLKV